MVRTSLSQLFLVRMPPLSLMIRIPLAHFWFACPPLSLLVRMPPSLTNDSHVSLLQAENKSSGDPETDKDTQKDKAMTKTLAQDITRGRSA